MAEKPLSETGTSLHQFQSFWEAKVSPILHTKDSPVLSVFFKTVLNFELRVTYYVLQDRFNLVYVSQIDVLQETVPGRPKLQHD